MEEFNLKLTAFQVMDKFRITNEISVQTIKECNEK